MRREGRDPIFLRILTCARDSIAGRFIRYGLLEIKIMTAYVKAAAMVLLGVVVCASSAVAEDIPQYVMGPISGLIYDCQENKQTPPRQADYVTSADFDGDGKPDYIIDTGKGCASNRALYCNAEGCTIDVYVSTLEGLGGSFRATSVAIGMSGEGTALVLSQRGEACGGAKDSVCTTSQVFDGKAFAAAQTPR